MINIDILNFKWVSTAGTIQSNFWPQIFPNSEIFYVGEQTDRQLWQNDYQSVRTDNSFQDLSKISRNETEKMRYFHAIIVILGDNEQTPAASFRLYICSLCDLFRHINSNKQ